MEPDAPARACPHCGRAVSGFPSFARYAFSSWLFPFPCAGCGARFYLNLRPVAFFLIWVLVSPMYFLTLLLLSLALLPKGVATPVFFIAAVSSGLLLPFFGRPRFKSAPRP